MKPRILFLCDRPGWAFDHLAHGLTEHLDDYDFRTVYVVEKPDLQSWAFDLLFVPFWGETYHQNKITDSRRVLKLVSSHRWANEKAYGMLDTATFCETFLKDAGTVACISDRLFYEVGQHRKVFRVRNGIDTNIFFPARSRKGGLRIGWAGNISDPQKRYQEILKPIKSDFHLEIAPGDLARSQMNQFYNSIDILCISSRSEGEPLTLLESMATGCVPISTDVGIVPELIEHRKNGLIVRGNSAAFRAALEWCTFQSDFLESAAMSNVEKILNEWSWSRSRAAWKIFFEAALANL